MRDTGEYDHGLWLECNAAAVQQDLNRHYGYCHECEELECPEARHLLKERDYWEMLAYEHNHRVRTVAG